MNLTCFPMIPKSFAIKKYEELILPNLSDTSKFRSINNFIEDSSEINWLPVGTKIEMAKIASFRRVVFEKVSDQFPLLMDDNNIDGRKLDLLLIKIIGPSLKDMGLTASMAAVMDMWYYMNIVLFPELVIMRWKKRSNNEINPERFFTATRNYIGSLWSRFFFFFDPENTGNPWWIIENLTEDDFVGMLERTNSKGAIKITRQKGALIAKMRMDNKTKRTFSEIDSIIRNFHKNVAASINCFDIAFLSKNVSDINELLNREMARAINNVNNKLD